jgi:hypothetical protein
MTEKTPKILSKEDRVNISYLNSVLTEKGREQGMSIEFLAQCLMSRFPKQYAYDPLQDDFLKVRQIVENIITNYVNSSYFLQRGNIINLVTQEQRDLSHYLDRCKEIINEFKSGKNHFPENPDSSCDLGYLQMVLANEYSPNGNSKIWQTMFEKFEKMLEMFLKEGFLKDEDFPGGKAIIEYTDRYDDRNDEGVHFEHDDDGA